ncbi:MAG: hypothetical protein EZS28_037373, partial [Streblomastix strix]
MVRFKRRYMLIQIDWMQRKPNVDTRAVGYKIQEEVAKHFGDFGAGLVLGTIICIKYFESSSRMIIRTDRDNRQ